MSNTAKTNNLNSSTDPTFSRVNRLFVLSVDYEYFSKNYKLIAIDLSKKMELENPDLKQQINFIGKLERNEGCNNVFHQ